MTPSDPDESNGRPEPDGLRELATAYRRTRQMFAKLLLRLAPTELQRLFALTVVIGGACGLAAVSFHLAIGLASRAAIDRATNARGYTWIAWTLIVPALGGLVSGVLLSFLVPNARGSGIPQVKAAYANHGGRMRLRDSIGKFVVSVIQIGTGSSLGREGPTVQICAGVAGALGRVARVSQSNLRRLLPVGAAAGVAAAFNAPIAAVTFTIEEIVGTLDQTVLSGVIVAAALAAVVERTVLGVHPVLDTQQTHHLDGASSLVLYAILGVAAAGVSVVFTESLLWLRAWFRRLKQLPKWAQPTAGGLATGLLAVLALLFLKTGGVTGGGYDTLSVALRGGLSVKVMLALCVLKIIATVASYSSGGAGGIFAPALFIGGTLGGAFGALDVALFHHSASSLGAFALVGMGAVFAGTVRAPITSVLIIIEMTNGYSLILPLMIANMSAYALARHLRPTSVYDALLAQDGIRVEHAAAQRLAEFGTLEQLLVDPRPFASFAATAPLRDLLASISRSMNQEVFPVTDDGKLVGVISIEDVTGVSEAPHVDMFVIAADMMRPPIAARRDDNLFDAYEKLLSNRMRELPVTDGEGRVVGLVDVVSIAHAVMRARPPKPH